MNSCSSRRGTFIAILVVESCVVVSVGLMFATVRCGGEGSLGLGAKVTPPSLVTRRNFRRSLTHNNNITTMDLLQTVRKEGSRYANRFFNT